MRVGGAIRAAAAAAATFEDAVVAASTTAGHVAAASEALQFVAAFEPELLLPHLTFGGADQFLGWAEAEFAPCFERFVPAADTRRAAEWVARVALVLWCSPSAPVSLTDEGSVRPFVRDLVLPGLQPRNRPT